MTIIRPEFLLPNYISPKFNPDVVITLSPTANWYQDNKKYLYDDYAGFNLLGYNKGLLYSDEADDDTVTLEIKVDLGSLLLIDVIRACNINFVDLLIEISDDDSTYTTLKEVTDNDTDFVSWYALNDSAYAAGAYYLTTNQDQFVTTSTGELIEITLGETTRYIKFTFSGTRVPDSEKFIGELYIGRLLMRPNNISLMSESFSDTNSLDLTMYNNKTNRKVNNAVLSQQLSFHSPNMMEFNVLKYMVMYGAIVNYIPNPFGLDVTNDFTGKDIYLVQARTQEFNYQSFGQNADGSLSITIKEASIVTRQF